MDPAQDSENNDQEETQSHSSFSDEAPIDKTNRKLFVLGIIFLLFIILSTAAFCYFILNSQEENEVSVLPKEPNQESSSSAQVGMKDSSEIVWVFEVLNGSGKAGAAKKAADKLQSLGYPVIKTGNAPQSNYKENQIFINTELKGKVGSLIDRLKDEFNISTISGEFKDSTASARIIIGRN
jgi:hypothetical protein